MIKSKVDPYKSFFMYAALIFLGGATTLTRYKMTSLSVDVGGVIAVLLVLFLGVKYRVRFDNRYFYSFLAILLIWSVFQSIKWGTVLIPVSLIWDVIAAYIICVSFRTSIFKYYERCMYIMCLIALVLWLLSMMIPYFPQFLQQISPNWIHGLIESNILVFGLQPSGSEAALFFRRNVGFAWEPGRFASFIVVAMFINIVMYKFRIRNNKHFWIFLVTLLSTQSTTGYATLVVVVLTYLFNAQRKYFIQVSVIAIPSMLFLFSLPFMTEKISDLMIGKDHNEEFVQASEYKVSQGTTFVPQRFDGLLWETYNFINEPLLGYGKDAERSFTGKTFSNQVVLYNGTIKIFAMFGVFLGILIYIMYYNGSIYFTRIFRFKGESFFFITFFLINISYPFHTEPVFLAMFCLPYFTTKEYDVVRVQRTIRKMRKQFTHVQKSDIS